MNDVVIDVQGLGKKYRLGTREKGSDTIMGSIVSGLTGPIRNFRSIRGLSGVGHENDRVFWAIKDVSFRVSRGEVLGVIGHNGAGKSTLLKILSRITEPSKGEVVIRGRVSSLLEVGTGFHPELTGRENIYMNGTILGMTRREIDRKFEEIVEFSGVQRHIDTPVKFYSSGMKVRLGFSVAAHLEPDILIIDEVLAVGDLEFQRKCLGRMELVASEGRTVLFVSHDLLAIQNLCSRCILLDNGIVKIDNNANAAVEAYRDTYKLAKNSDSLEMTDSLKKKKSSIFATNSISLKTNRGLSRRVFSGEPFSLLLSFFNLQNQFAELDIAVVIRSRSMVPIVTFSTSFHRRPLKIQPGKGVVSCQVRNLFLTAGEYHVYVWTSVDKVVAEVIENACEFEVIDVDIFRTGVVPNQRNHGYLIHLDYNIDLNEN